MDENTGHGHVSPRPDGVKARCGGPGICADCSREASLVDVSSRRLLVIIADLLYSDPHQWSTRQCPTCRAVTAMIDAPYGCDRYRMQKKDRE